MNLQDVETFYPLSPLQEGLLFHGLSDRSQYFNQTVVTLHGALNVEAFERAWQTVVDRHAILRTFFVWEGVPTPVQVVKKHARMPLEVHDWRHLSAAEQTAQRDTLRREDLARGSDFSVAPLMRGALLRTADESYDLLWSFHHILMDGWSMFTVLREVFGAYDGLAGGLGWSAPRPAPYRNYIAWLKSQSLENAERYWRRALAGFTAPTQLLVDPEAHDEARAEEGAATRDLPAREDFEALVLHVPAVTTAALDALARRNRLTLNTILQGTWALLLARYADQDDVVFGTVVSGRPADLDGVEAMVGLFINTLPVRVRVPDEAHLLEWLAALQAQNLEQREYEYSPLARVQGWSSVPGGTQLFESLFLFENYKKDAPLEALCEHVAIGDVIWYERHNYPLAAVAIPASKAPGSEGGEGGESEELALRLIYQTERYAAPTIERMLGHWRALLEGLAARSDRGLGARLGELSLMTAAEREELLVARNATRTDYPRDETIHALFATVARETPDALAVSYAGTTLTYAELDARSNQLARRLRVLGVGPEVLVGLALERSLELPVAMLAILKAGGAYVALDAEDPPERLAAMLADARTPVVVTQARLAAKLPAVPGAHVLALDAEAEALARESSEPVADTVGPTGLAYVIYTSGSTGRPKGTCVPHRAVVRLARGQNFLAVRADDVFLQFAPASFDAATLEIWGALLNGARLAVHPAGKASLEDLGRVLRAERVTLLWLTAGLFHRLVEERLDVLSGLRTLLAGGDVLSPRHVRMALEGLPGCTVVNGYGPTENTTFTCCHVMTSPPPARTVPIGRPIANTTVYVLDAQMEPVPVGVPGDLYAGGDGVARGYLNRPELTAERFLPDPFSFEPDARMYATGDRARWLADGTLEFLGRRDFQVKIRGFRIELGEIEIALGEHPAVRNAVVLAREDSPGEKRLVAYVVREPAAAAHDSPGSPGSPASIEDLRAHLAARLPDYMLPSAFVFLEALPLTPNGKVDRRALPAPEDGVRPELSTAFAAPEAPTEQKIAAIWRMTLALDQVGVHDNFFDLGGNSLHLIGVHAKLQAALARELPMVALFRFPTIRALAEHLDAPATPDSPTPDARPDSAAQIRTGRGRLQDMQRRRRRE